MESLVKTIEEWDSQIVYLINKLEAKGNMSHVVIDFQSHLQAAFKGVHNAQEIPTPKKVIQVSANGTFDKRQLQDVIKDVIKDQLGGNGQTSIAYFKPYTSRIDMMKMSMNY